MILTLFSSSNQIIFIDSVEINNFLMNQKRLSMMLIRPWHKITFAKYSKNGVGQGSNPVWKEKFLFNVEYPGSGEGYKLALKIMDKDTFSADDYIGQAT